MKLDVRYANHPNDSKRYDTEELRKHYLVESVFEAETLRLTYSHQDRMIAGGAMPLRSGLRLEAGKEFGTEYFLERRELGIINIGGAGSITLDGKEYGLESRDGMYIGMGIKEVILKSADPKNPAKFYLNSAPAHQEYPSALIRFKDANPLHMGDQANLNKRTIYQYIHPKVCKSCQLVMGMTLLEPHNVWNTMPCHTHERRMEVYFYFDMNDETRVFHLMGRPRETRHIVMKNEQAVISPSWSIHSGVGTSELQLYLGNVRRESDLR